MKFEAPKRTVPPKAKNPRAEGKSAMRSKRTTVYAKKNSGRPNFRPSGRSLSVVKKYIKDAKSRAVPRGVFLLSFWANFVGERRR